MEWFKDYLLSVIAAATVCGCLRYIIGKKAIARRWIRMLCGIFLTCTIIKPILSLDLGKISHNFQSYQIDAEAAVQLGRDTTYEKIAASIKEKTQTYILDKAAAWEVVLDVDVTVADLVPTEVIIRGAVSPYVKTALSDWISVQLGIPKEAQQWINPRS